MKASRSFGSRCMVAVRDLAVSVRKDRPQEEICLILLSPRTGNGREAFVRSSVEMSRQEAQSLYEKLARALGHDSNLVADLVRGLGIGFGSGLAKELLNPNKPQELSLTPTKPKTAGGAS